MFKKAILLSTSLTLAAAIALPAQAQDYEDEIIITATKRPQTLQATPVAVTVTGADVIEKAQILDIKDLQSVVPTFRVSQLQNSANTTLTIRGFGNGGNNYGIEPAVGLFIDGVYRSRAAAQISDLPALERVEVLSGPQSTLFGKNASAGVVSIVTEKPQFETTGYVEGGYGNYNQNYVKGYITGGVSETVAVSLGVGYQKRDGYFKNTGAGGDELNNIDRFNLRGQILWEPTDDLAVRLIGDLSDLSENCCGTGVAIEGPLAAGAPTAGQLIGLLGGRQPTAADQFSYETFTNSPTKNDIKDSGVSAQIDYDLGFASLTSITAIRKTDSSYISDSDYNSLDVLANVSQSNVLDTFTQELRLASNGGNQLEWMIGGYYFDETIDQDSGLLYGADTRRYIDALAPPGALAGIEQLLGYAPNTFFGNGTTIDEKFTQQDEAYSIFGTLDFGVSDRLTLTAGGNYTKDKKQVSGSSVNNDVFGNLSLGGADGTQVLATTVFLQGAPGVPSFSQALNGLPFTAQNLQLALAGQFGLQAQGYVNAVFANSAALAASPNNPLAGLYALQFQPQFLAFPNVVEDGRTSDDEFTYTLKAAYELSDNINVYGSYATGFKASSWNLTRDSRPFQADAIALQGAGLLPNNYNPATGRNFGTRFSAPETVEVFELGMKARFGYGAINVAVFDQTVNNFQSTIFQGTGFVLANAGQQSTRGIEFDSTYSPVEALTLTFAGVIQDPTYDSFAAAPGPNGTTVDLSGQKPAGINEIALSASATYTHEFESGMSAFIRGNYQYEDEVQIVDNIAGLNRDTSLVNASVGFDFDNGVELRLWGSNLFNHETYTSAFPGVIQAGTVNAYPNQPRTYGAVARYTF